MSGFDIITKLHKKHTIYITAERDLQK